jgi:hypothetical protein
LCGSAPAATRRRPMMVVPTASSAPTCNFEPRAVHFCGNAVFDRDRRHDAVSGRSQTFGTVHRTI